MPIVKLLIDGPYDYSDGRYQKGDEFYVGPKACEDGVKNKTFEFVSDDPPPKPFDARTPEQKIATLEAEKAALEAELDTEREKTAQLTHLLEGATK